MEAGMLIGGAVQTAEVQIPVINPATETPVGLAPAASAADVDRAVSCARTAFAGWRSDELRRAETLSRAAKVIDAAAEELGALTTAEQGKPLASAVLEAKATAALLLDAASLRLPDEIIRDDGARYARVVRRPLGVVAAITPWNSALYVAGMKLGPALAAGNTVVLKPSPETPLATLRLGELLADVFPPGVLNVVTGSNDVGPRLTGHPDVRVVSFTGSIAVGKDVAKTAAGDLKAVVLELGGNDPAVVLDDARVDEVVASLFGHAFGNAGQVCSGVKRLYVHEHLFHPVLEGFVERARRAVVGDGVDPRTEIGPLTTKAQLDHVVGLVDGAVAAGASVVAGGRRLERPGYFYPPTIVVGAGDDDPLVATEQFGPALPVLSFRAEDEVLRRVNRGMYGLGGSVWTSDFERGRALVEQFESGMSWVNTHKGAEADLPFAGCRWSGLGVERGRWGLECFTRLHVISGTR
jgi:acyl-CoA reductase-like NAD-dependent aldehyde dehydrogenase